MNPRQDSCLLGGSPAILDIHRRIRAVANSKAAVFITGATGTGKELCARAIHRAGRRAQGPWIAINCGAIPRELLESEIFGHRKGSFTGAWTDRDGAARLADGGTLFLDEICELELAMQSKLLRFLDTGVVQKVGSSVTEPVDIRVICATNRNPAAEVEAGRFREDLYYRLNALPVHMPLLRDRRDDVPLLALHFLEVLSREEGKGFVRMSAEAQSRLLAHDWPGNVRELQNVLRRAIVFHEGETIEPSMLDLALNPADAAAEHDLPFTIDTSGLRQLHAIMSDPRLYSGRKLWQIERDAIRSAIAACGDSIPEAARTLGVSPSTIYRKRESWS
jgi:DNA-binding NtrC family response regulator